MRYTKVLLTDILFTVYYCYKLTTASYSIALLLHYKESSSHLVTWKALDYIGLNYSVALLEAGPENEVQYAPSPTGN